MRATGVIGGRYELGALIGRGGMAEVYEARDERLDRAVAVKVLRPELAGDAEVRARFELEARAAATLVHHHVVQVYDSGEDGGVPFIAMERLPGETLADWIGMGPVDPVWLRRRAREVLQGLGAAHAAGIVHRDVKPGNILIDTDGAAKISDFGIAKSLEPAADASTMTATHLLVGTPAYVAPERMAGHPATPASDLYSMGLVLYEALAGGRPADGATIPTSVPADMVAAVDRALRPNPLERFASAEEMGAALAGDDRTTVVAAPVAAATAASAWRPPVGAVVAVALGALLLLGIVVAAATSDGDEKGENAPAATTVPPTTAAEPAAPSTTGVTRATTRAPDTTDAPAARTERRERERESERERDSDKKKGKRD